MKMMSMKASFNEVDNIRKMLAEHDAAVFKVIELTETFPDNDLQVIYCQILFYVMSNDAETFLKLKFPSNTFESVDA